MSNWKCIKCGAGVSGGSHPLIGKCPKGEGHDWIANDGKSKNWKCIKCGAGVSGGSHPLVSKCPKGGGHDWVER